jgi:hypothetical protein
METNENMALDSVSSMRWFDKSALRMSFLALDAFTEPMAVGLALRQTFFRAGMSRTIFNTDLLSRTVQ